MKIYKGTYGFNVLLQTNLDLTSATSLTIHYKKPSGVSGSKTAALFDNNSCYWLVKDGDIDEAGEWILQLEVQIGSMLLRSSSVLMDVLDHFE